MRRAQLVCSDIEVNRSWKMAVKFSEIPGLMQNCSFRYSYNRPLLNEVILDLFTWGQVSVPMIKLAVEIIGEDRVLNMDEEDEDYCERLEEAGWDSSAVSRMMEFFKYADVLPELQ